MATMASLMLVVSVNLRASLLVLTTLVKVYGPLLDGNNNPPPIDIAEPRRRSSIVGGTQAVSAKAVKRKFAALVWTLSSC